MITDSGKPTLCVVNFNGRNALPPTLAAARELRDCFAAIVLLDNGSTDDSVAYVEGGFPEVQILKLGTNRGAGGARNEGLRQAPTDRILFADNDVALTRECVERLGAALDGHPRAALAAATIVYAHRRDTIQYDGAECHFLGIQRLLDEDQPRSAVPPAVRKVGSLSTCCFMADRSRIPAGEFFDESYFYIFEDHDYGVRLRLLGAEILSVTDAPCYHGMGTEGLSIRQLGSYSSKRIHYTIRNRWLMLLKNFQLHTLLVLTPMFIVYELAQLLLIVKKGWLKEWWQAARWIVANLPAIWRERRRIQRARRVPDRAVLIGGAAPFRAELTAGALERFARRSLDLMLGSYWKLASVLI
jgi:GT2 family glycosyltransferase